MSELRRSKEVTKGVADVGVAGECGGLKGEIGDEGGMGSFGGAMERRGSGERPGGRKMVDMRSTERTYFSSRRRGEGAMSSQAGHDGAIDGTTETLEVREGPGRGLMRCAVSGSSKKRFR